MMAVLNNEEEKQRKPCHWLPCSIDFDGVAPVHLYFNPTSLPVTVDEDIQPKNIDSTDESLSSDIKCASLRGRGLLSRQTNSLPSQINGMVLTLDSQASAQMNVTDTFESMLEWEHQWDEKRLLNKIEEGKYDMRSNSNVERSLALMQVLRSVRTYNFVFTKS